MNINKGLEVLKYSPTYILYDVNQSKSKVLVQGRRRRHEFDIPCVAYSL